MASDGPSELGSSIDNLLTGDLLMIINHPFLELGVVDVIDSDHVIIYKSKGYKHKQCLI